MSRSISSLIDDTVQQAPDRIAVAHGDAQLSYRALAAAADRIAQALAGHAIGANPIIALLVDRDLSLLPSILGILQAGAAYLPLDPDHPADRLAQILAQARAPIVVVGAAHEAQARAAIDRLAPADRPRMVSLDALPAAPGPRVPAPALGGDRLAYVIFTSGSTGAPKGAMLAHAGKINHMRGMLERLELGADDVIAQTASACFDLSVWQLLAPLLVGGRVEIFDTALLADPARMLAHIERTRATVVEAVPSVVANLLDELERLGDARPAFAALRWMIPTAEAVPPELYRRWLRLYPGHRMANAYGPTEAHDVTNLFVVSAPPGDAEPRVPIGTGLPNVRIYLCDAQLTRVPVGVAGELCVGGIAVGRGYLHDPAGTAAAFVPDPFSDVPGARLYRTGDRCRYRADGTIEFLERCDLQIKIRGHRIEVGDIERAIARGAGIWRCVVAAAGPDRDRLVAYLVLDGAALDAPCTVWPATSAASALDARILALHADLQQRLPRAWIPWAYVVLPRLPVTPNGKIDRRALPAPDGDVRPATAAPETSAERTVAQIWQAVLGRPVGVDDDFFELGGHSLIVVRVQSRLREAFGLDLPLRTLFELSTVRQLAQRIEAIRWAIAPATEAPAPAEDDEDIEI